MTQPVPEEFVGTYQERTLGERSAIRRFDHNNPADVAALIQICQSEESRRWLQDVPTNTGETRDWIIHPGQTSFLFAISGSSVHVGLGQVGEVQGFIYIYPTGIDTANNLSIQEFISPKEFKHAMVREVSYGLKPSALDHQVASALRQAIFQDEGNIVPSEKYPTTDLIYMAFTDPENTDSERVLRASGFDKIGQSKYESDESLDNVWRLNPNKLDRNKIDKLTINPE